MGKKKEVCGTAGGHGFRAAHGRRFHGLLFSLMNWRERARRVEKRDLVREKTGYGYPLDLPEKPKLEQQQNRQKLVFSTKKNKDFLTCEKRDTRGSAGENGGRLPAGSTGEAKTSTPGLFKDFKDLLAGKKKFTSSPVDRSPYR